MLHSTFLRMSSYFLGVCLSVSVQFVRMDLFLCGGTCLNLFFAWAQASYGMPRSLFSKSR
jgi:hypothetical protein